MQHRKDRRQQLIVALLILMLVVVMVGVMEPGAAQAANFGGLTDNGTARFMGIGTTYNPSRNLHVVGSPLFERAVDTAGFLIKRTSTNRWFLGVNENPLIGYGFVISTFPEGAASSTPRLLVTQDGRVGINTTNPYTDTKLTVINDNLTRYTAAIYGETLGDNDTWGCVGYNIGNGSTGSLGGALFGGAPIGVAGYANSIGVYGESPFFGVWGTNSVNPKVGVLGTQTEGVYGNSGGYGNAGLFDGNVQIKGSCNITGTMYAASKAFRIDHPLYPADKYLQHSTVESPDMKNVYDGIAVLDNQGGATVTLPAYFEALNRDFRYQLTCLGGYAPVYVSQKIKDNNFRIAGGEAGMEVSWQVTGIRNDPYAANNPIVVEQDKSAGETGQFIYPAGYGQPQTQAIGAQNGAYTRMGLPGLTAILGRP